jgi:hypothetical protein
MSARQRGIVATITATTAVLLLAACTAQSAPGPTSTPAATVAPSASTPTPAPSVSASSTAEATCESILPSATVADFEKVGWTAKEETFHVGATELEDGIQCTWGDYSVASDHVLIYGWAPITETQADVAMDELLESGWRREDSADGIYVTESADTAIAPDEDGYGITYLFGDGWVTVSDTKQGLVLVERPQG